MFRLITTLLFCSTLTLVFSQTQRAEQLRSNVVAISAQGEKGFGFITGERGNKLFVVTAYHVVEYAVEANQNVTIKFYQDYNTYSGRIIRSYKNVDVALLEVDQPSSFSWEPNCLGVATNGADVAFIGREGEWYIPSGRALGNIYSLQNNQIQVDITSITPGTSGGPLIAESGIVGMIIESTGIRATAVDLNQLRAVLSEYDYFFSLTGAGLLSNTGTDDFDTDAILKDIQAYKAAQKKDDISSYQIYIRDFPRGEFRDKAIERIQELEREKAAQQEEIRWEVAQVRDDVTGYQTYLSEYPSGKYRTEANRRIQVLQKEAEQPNIPTNNTRNSTEPSNPDRITDRDGNTYATKIMKDGKRWMTKNLNIKVDDSWCYEDKSSNCNEYGRLYTFEAAKEGCQLLGNGWRLPTDEEWREMAKQYGGADDDASDGGKAAYEALLGNGSSGFAAQLGGWRNSYYVAVSTPRGSSATTGLLYAQQWFQRVVLRL
jgi:uncharacterized protein (TIGR02145 family)